VDEVAIFNVALEDGLEKATGIIQIAVSSADKLTITWASIKKQ